LATLSKGSQTYTGLSQGACTMVMHQPNKPNRTYMHM